MSLEKMRHWSLHIFMAVIRKIFNLVLLTVGTAVAAPAAAAPVADSVAVADTVACIDALDAAVNTRQSPYYGWKRDVSYTGVPLLLSSVVVKDAKTGFPSPNLSLKSGFKTKIDNYTRFAPYPVIAAMKLAGYEGRSSWSRLGVSALASNAVMAMAVMATKHAVSELRPDATERNSFPSGHTATAFVAATILHKEYGMTRSPWFSVGGYALATATGVMRVLNNRHWISDVMAGAGIGIISTELGYFAADLIFKDRGVERYELDGEVSVNPSFVDIQMGVAAHSGHIDFGTDRRIALGTSAVVGMEGAYFLNKHFGVGAQARLISTPAQIEGAAEGATGVEIEDNQFNNASLAVGVYGNQALSKRISVGAKALCGVRFADGIRYVNHQSDATEILQAKGGTAFNYVLGVNFAWRYRTNFAWKLFADLDAAKTTYTYQSYTTTKTLAHATLGVAFSVVF